MQAAKFANDRPLRPCEFPRRVLLVVSGLTPQIATETVYALATDPTHEFVPTEVHLITTTEGAQRAALSLLSDDLGWFGKLCADYGLQGVRFDHDCIHVVRDHAGRLLNDIRTPSDNEAAADFITAHVRSYTSDPHCALHASIAGGRKTMGFYLGYALSLHGRTQDRLSHVLVNEPFESSYEFFYPTTYSRVLELRDGRLADTANAQVTLAEIPFVSLRHGLPQALLSGTASFNETVAAARIALAPPELVLDLAEQRIVASGRVVILPPAELALLAVFARRRVEGSPPLPAPPKDSPIEQWARLFLAEYRRIVPHGADIEATERALRHGMDGSYFSTHKSKLRKLLRDALGPASAAYDVSDGGSRPRLYQLVTAAHAIRFTSNVARPFRGGLPT